MAEKKLTFEQSMTRLEEIVAKLERGDAALEEALALFEEGTGLMKKCSVLLDKAEQQVVKLTAGADGKPVEAPLDGEGQRMTHEERLHEDCRRIDGYLNDVFARREPKADLYDAMLYSLLAGGKRIRPVMTLEVCRMCGGDTEKALPFACAVEMVHTYSLIHDDLPCMDDDDLRRGRPTNHKVYGEATAVLAGDALLTAAFETIAEHGTDLPPDRVLAACACLGRAAGARGMVGGQVLDMAGEGRALALSEVEELQKLKTGALISAAAEMGCIVAGGDETARSAVRKYAEKLGLAFQIRDDMLDVLGSEQVLGKPIGSDARSEKTTFVTIKGMENCGALVREKTQAAMAAIDGLGDTGFLCWLAERLVAREN